MNETKPEETTAGNGRLHESKDANIRAVTLFGVGLAGLEMSKEEPLSLVCDFPAGNRRRHLPGSFWKERSFYSR